MHGKTRPAARSLFALVFAGVPRVSRKTFWCLRESRKSLEKLFGVCGSPASLSRNFLAFAGVSQVSRETFWCLRESRKSLGKLFGVCGSPASLSENFLVFAGVPQATKSAFQHLRKFRKQQKVLFSICGSSAGHFQKRFGHHVASVEALCRLYSYVELTFSICVFDVVPPSKSITADTDLCCYPECVLGSPSCVRQ